MKGRKYCIRENDEKADPQEREKKRESMVEKKDKAIMDRDQWNIEEITKTEKVEVE